MNLPQEGCLLRIMIGEQARFKGQPLYEWLVVKAREMGLAGATVLRGMMGYGASSRIKTSRILRLSEDLPIVVEIVDTREKLEGYLQSVDPHISDGLATLEKAEVRFYRSSR